MTTGRALCFLVGALGFVGCSRQVRLVVPETDYGGVAFVCTAADGEDSPSTCASEGREDPSINAKSGTAFIVLPKECDGRFHELLIENADSSSPTVRASCATRATPDEPIEKIGPLPGGG